MTVQMETFGQCEAQLSQLQEENIWLHDRINNVANRVDEFARTWTGGYGGVGRWNVGYNTGYPGYPGYPGHGYLDGMYASLC